MSFFGKYAKYVRTLNKTRWSDRILVPKNKFAYNKKHNNEVKSKKNSTRGYITKIQDVLNTQLNACISCMHNTVAEIMWSNMLVVKCNIVIFTIEKKNYTKPKKKDPREKMIDLKKIQTKRN